VSVLALSGVTKHFGGLVAVSDFNLEMAKGELVGLIGPNGAGKTTVFNVVTGMYQPTEGSIAFMGEDITGQRPHIIARKGIARTFQNLRLFRNLTALANVLTAAQMGVGYSFLAALTRSGSFQKGERETRERSEYLLEMVGLGDKMREKASNLPYGYQRKLEVARALALSPRLLLLDEPAAGMNPDESLDLMDLIQRIREEFHLTILLIEHHMDVVMGICERILVLNFGTTIAEGCADEVQENEEVIKAYLGEEVDEDA
jgi:branched-chain amino acid transport system ATP-binding protein